MSLTSVQARIKEIQIAKEELEKQYDDEDVEFLRLAMLTVIADKLDDIADEISKSR